MCFYLSKDFILICNRYTLQVNSISIPSVQFCQLYLLKKTKKIMSVDLVIGTPGPIAVPMNINDNGTLGTPVSLPLGTPSAAGLISADDKALINKGLMIRNGSIGASQNLNTYQTTGLYIQDNNINAGTGSNYPVTSTAGVLEVIATGLFIWQKYHTYQGLNSNRLFTRSYYNGTWSPWKLLIDTSLITGTANRTTVTNGVVDIAATYVGQTSVTTLGTIGTGTWNGTAIDVSHGGTGLTSAGSNGQILVSDGTNFVLTTPTQVSSGNYTPTITGSATSYTAQGFRYTRIGDIVQVSGIIEISGGPLLQDDFKVSIPIPSAFTNDYDASGVVSGKFVGAPKSNLELGNYVLADTAGGGVFVYYIPVDTGNRVHVDFSYTIL